MKKNVFFAAVAIGLLAGCTSDERIGGEVISPNTSQAEQGAIVFSTVSKGITRADHVGADAAKLLNNKFIVGGYKGAGDITATGTSKVFDNYTVEWAQNTAATTESNTSDWEYVGKNPAPTATVTGLQTIKYWDYSAAQYDFIAYSTGTAEAIKDGNPAAGQIVVSTISPSNATSAAYTLKGSVNDLTKCYIADMVTVTKSSNNYGKEVQLSFRSLATKIRVAFYETIPGYSVKDVKFYTDDATTPIETGASATNATLFIPSGSVGFGSAGTYTISFPTIGSSNSSKPDYNKAHVSFTADATVAEADKKKDFGALNYTTAERNEATGNHYLGRTSHAASYAGTDPYYYTVLSNPTGAVLELRIDYTLVSIDGSGETINIRGAKAYVPAIYAKWQPNYAYTYIFKISDNTNGWTSKVDTDPAGLYPITFDAVVADSEDGSQSTITTVATPSITTYQKGHDITKDEYSVLTPDGDIYVQVIANGTLKGDLGSNGQLYSLSAAKTEAEVMDALNIQTASDANSITGRNGLVLTKVTSDATITAIPGVDGNDITVTAGTAAKFTPTAGKTYAYVYDTGTDNADTEYNTAVVLTAQPTDWPTGYYTDEACTTAATTYADGTYYQKYTNQNKVYGVKVIKVVAAP